ncbi:MAG: leucine--tRNA ligase [Candidatus Thermoplasmatota archaeon]|nr:leucine--tRNA ligase [Candidatus Thermoplasmatota archaeon]
MSDEPIRVDEVAWQRRWDEEAVFVAPNEGDRPTFYCLEMYPYPSGKMHMGHVRNYSIGDAVARYKRMRGFDVLYPMGFDSFGMPAENAAIEEGGHPHDITERNMASITAQIKRMGFSYDWDRLVKSHDPNYYRWNQWFFLKFLEQGLAYREQAPVNWCEPCTTVLANEQVKAGRCWRCNGPVIQKDMSQWFLDLPKYAQELVDGLDTIDFPEHVSLLQKDWLGRSEGAEIAFQLENDLGEVRVFTTRPDTLFGVTFLTMAPEHPMAAGLMAGRPEEAAWRELRDEVALLSEFDRIKQMKKKKGIFSGLHVIHPLTGERIPMWFGNFVIASYGTGAVMAVPGHDQRDFEFATTCGLPVRRVIADGKAEDAPMTKAHEDMGPMINSPLPGFDGLEGDAAKHAVITALEEAEAGDRTLNWKIRPWLVSRQRYWGTPIPIIHCPSCGVVPVPEEDLPVVLPRDVAFTGTGNPLLTSPSFLEVDCPACGESARRETDTMDTFVDSSWYFMRYVDAKNEAMCFDADVADRWMNVDFYCGGIEHAQMHLIYARFWTKALRDLGLHSIDEPFQSLLCQGMVNKAAPWCDSCAVTLPVSAAGAPCPQCGDALGERSAKMSKSLGNTVSPEAMIEQYGADTVRLFILFAANPTAGMDWSDTAVEANHRVIQHLLTLPDVLLSWDGEAHPMDAWMEARLDQRTLEWADAMESYDLRKAVEISHFELVKDLNWYLRRAPGSATLGRVLLERWAHLLAVSTPHMAEAWWAAAGHDDLLASRVLDMPAPLSEAAQLRLDEEAHLRDMLDQARRVKTVAERHLDGPARTATFAISAPWRRALAEAALRHLAEDQPIKAFAGRVASLGLVDEARTGELMGFWGKRMLPQVFKWDDEIRRILLSGLDEAANLAANADFIAATLELERVEVVMAESPEDTTERGGAAMPYAPSVVFA